MSHVPELVYRWKDHVGTTIARLGYPLDPALALAIVWQESEGVPYKWNPEPRYRWIWNVKENAPFRQMTSAEIASEVPPGDFPALAGDRDQEWWGQQVSWGLTQIMGAAAREEGFKGGWLPELIFDPYLNLEFGIKHLWRYAFQKGNRLTVDALLRYNGGGNAKYPSEVLHKRAEIIGNAHTSHKIDP